MMIDVFITAKNECQNPGKCQNGHCTDLERGYFCTCTEGYTGTNCEMPGKNTYILRLLKLMDL